MEQILLYQNDTEKHEVMAVAEAQTRETLDTKIARYLMHLKDIEQRCLRPDANPEKLLDEITLLNDGVLQACAEFERSAGHDPVILRDARQRFREQTQEMLSKSYFINHARTWPRGYQGDHLILEAVYRNIPLAAGVGHYLDRYSLSTSLAVAVRERRETLSGIVRRELGRRVNPRVLDVACGSCREVFEMAPAIGAAGASFTCLDFDPASLEYAANRIPYSGLDPDRISFRQYNALKMINTQRNLKEFGKQDIIYSVGFFDYLEDDVLVRLLSALYDLLNPGGLLITSFKDCQRYGSQYYHWMVNWDGFLQRTGEESRALLGQAGIPAASVETLRDASQVIIFYNAVKK